MGTSFENVAERPITASTDASPARGVWGRAVGHVQAAVCGFHGHDPMLQFEQGRMFLRCTSCGYQSPGWDTGGRRPRLRFSGDATRHQRHASSPASTRSLA